MSRRLLIATLLSCALAACPNSGNGDGGTTGGRGSSSGAASGGGSSSGTSRATSGASSSGSTSGSSSGASGGGSTTTVAGSSSSGGGSSGGGPGSLVQCANGASASPTCVVAVEDNSNCGGCGIICGQTQVCSQGNCVTGLQTGSSCSYSLASDGGILCDAAGTQLCPPPTDAGYTSGCPCPDLQVDSSNCGACGNVCGGGQLCNAGSCAPACAAGQVEDLSLFSTEGASCLAAAGLVTQITVGPLTLTNTVCPATGSASAYLATLELDPNNCGSCGHVCPLGELCLGGQCSVHCGSSGSCDYPINGVCPTGESDCGGNTVGCQCADLQTDPSNCGACGTVCPSGACQAGQCASGCPSGQLCANTGSGSSLGACVGSCPTFFGLPMTSCGTGSTAFCTITAADDSNCGACGNVCPAGQRCADGVCAPVCNEDTQPCDGGCAIGQACVNAACVPACANGQICSGLYDACVSTCG